MTAGRTYNQEHVPRARTGKRRVSVYVTWSYPAEANADPATLDNRFSTMTEVRRVAWPQYEGEQWSPGRFQQGVAGTLELFFWAWTSFQRLVAEATGHPVPVFQRVDQAGFACPLDDRVLDDCDTLLVFGLDHTVTGQRPAADEVDALRRFVAREGTCLVLGPHHDVGASGDLAVREAEYRHHRDPLVPRQQRFAGYLRELMGGLGLPVENRYGLRPAAEEGARLPAPLSIDRDLDARGFLAGVTRFNFHPHLPHYATTDESAGVRVLARQPVDLRRPHPFTDAGSTEISTCLWLPPAADRAGDVLFVDSTVFSTLFGRDESLERFWRNLATARP